VLGQGSTDVKARQNEQRQGGLRGPSLGLRAWVDWVIDVRRRWHEADPKAGRRALLRSGGSLLALVAIAEKVLGG
jgi:hypothetical protein